MNMDARDFLVQRAVASEVPRIRAGASSYFTKPTKDLDPSLFGPDHQMHEHIRNWVLATLHNFWSHYYHLDGRWYTVWIAGSGITYQWSAARDPGDLDVLIGVDFDSFRRLNPDYSGFSDSDIGQMMNETLKANLWPQTAATMLGTGTYEVTFYVNPNSADIRFIHPYAAYNVTDDAWTVHPPELGPDWNPERDFPKEYWDQIGYEQAQATDLLKEYTNQLRLAKRGGAAERTNAAAMLTHIVQTGAAMFHDIHDQRKLAFGPDGRGYSDYYNFRWQAHKRNGVVPALHALAALHAEARDAQESVIYGHPLLDSDTALRTAAKVHSILDAVRM
jgi:hypothetical protein